MRLLRWIWANKWHELGHPAGVLGVAYVVMVLWPGLLLWQELAVGMLPSLAWQINDARGSWSADDWADIASLQVVWPLAVLPHAAPAVGLLALLLAVYLYLRARSLK